MTQSSRRTALKRTGALAATAMAAGLLRPADALADWNKGAFESKTVADALKNLKIGAAVDSKDIVIRAPDIAENGAVVPIEIQSNIPGTKAIAVLIEKNPFPYVANFDFAAGTLPFVALRVKMGETSNVRIVVAAADGKFYSAVKEVKVTIGGCGGYRENAMADPMKIRAKLEGDVLDVRVLMAHPMETGQRKDAAGNLVPLHFIQTITAQLNGKPVLEVETSQAISRNPVFGFKVKGAKAGDRLAITWTDNKGDKRTDEVTVAAG